MARSLGPPPGPGCGAARCEACTASAPDARARGHRVTDWFFTDAPMILIRHVGPHGHRMVSPLVRLGHHVGFADNRIVP